MIDKNVLISNTNEANQAFLSVDIQHMLKHLRDSLEVTQMVHLMMCELTRATSSHGRFNSAHEGYAVLLEEVDELWDHVKMKPSKRAVGDMKTEAIQVAAMAIRFGVDCCDEYS